MPLNRGNYSAGVFSRRAPQAMQHRSASPYQQGINRGGIRSALSMSDWFASVWNRYEPTPDNPQPCRMGRRMKILKASGIETLLERANTPAEAGQIIYQSWSRLPWITKDDPAPNPQGVDWDEAGQYACQLLGVEM